ncbi:MAG: sigma-70 family RNA polymerase sigma factor [Chloroflexota bacterium]
MVSVESGHGADDWTFVRAACTGDRDAHGALYDRYAVLCFSLAYRLLHGNREQAEDVLFNVFTGIAAAASAPSHAPSDVRLWLLSLVRERCRDLVRNQSLPETTTASGSQPGHERGTDGTGSIDAASVRNALADLPDDERHIIELAYFDGRTYTEIAEITEHRPESVQAGMRRALHSLGGGLARHRRAMLE